MGCYGEVFSAMLDGKPVAVKVMTASTTPSLRKAFVREVAALRALREHPNIVRLVGAALYPHWCIVMQLVHGGSLHDLLYARRVSLTLEQALRIGRNIAEALRHLHGLKSPIIHRDVTSRNVLLQVMQGSLPPMPPPDAIARVVDAQVVYQGLLSDFGIARTKGKSRSTDQLSPTGPRRFRAPEVAQKGPDGRYHYSRRVDVYMFGTVLFELLYVSFLLGPL
jgi:serine/threonine protein kinase